eukprot:scaffold5771_cov98-Isochrysis_galbana.AAC.1
MVSEPCGWICGCAATLWLLRERSLGVYRLTTPTHKGGVMCKALAGSGKLPGQVYMADVKCPARPSAKPGGQARGRIDLAVPLSDS